MEHLAKAGINCPTPVRDAQGRVLRTLAGRPAALVTFLEGVWIRRPQPRHCAGRRRGAGAAASGRPRLLPDSAPTRLGLAGWRPLLERFRQRAGEIAPGSAAVIEQELDPSGGALADGPGAGHHPRRPVSRQRVLSRRQALRPHRLLLRLQRCARLRHRRHPQRLVLRERPFLQHHQGPGAAQGLPERAPARRRRARGPAAAGARRGAALPADARLRLAAHGERRAGQPQGPARVSAPAQVSPQRTRRQRVRPGGPPDERQRQACRRRLHGRCLLAETRVPAAGARS